MKILVFEDKDGKPVYYGEPEKKTPEKSDASGLLAWADRQYSRFENAVHNSESGIGRRISRFWKALQRFESSDEALLRSLRHQTKIDLVHGATTDPMVAASRWNQYLNSNRRKHLFWVLVNLLISPVTILLAPIPGPNLVGYWFVYRAFCHLLSVLGAQQGADIVGETRFFSEPLLDEQSSDWSDAEITALSGAYELKNLAEFVGRDGPNQSEQASQPSNTEFV